MAMAIALYPKNKKGDAAFLPRLKHLGFLPQKMVKFVSYTGKYPNLCNGTLTLEVDDKEFTFKQEQYLIRSGGTRNGLLETTGSGEWIVDYDVIPDEIKHYAREIDACINRNIPFGCCGGCS